MAKVILKRNGEVEADGIIVGHWTATYPRKERKSSIYVNVLYIALMHVTLKNTRSGELTGYTKKELRETINANLL
jgi:hypothetical protein